MGFLTARQVHTDLWNLGTFPRLSPGNAAPLRTGPLGGRSVAEGTGKLGEAMRSRIPHTFSSRAQGWLGSRLGLPLVLPRS